MITQHSSFSFWPVSLSVTCAGSIHIVTNGRVLSFFMAEWYSVVEIPCIFSFRPLVGTCVVSPSWLLWVMVWWTWRILKGCPCQCVQNILLFHPCVVFHSTSAVVPSHSPLPRNGCVVSGLLLLQCCRGKPCVHDVACKCRKDSFLWKRKWDAVILHSYQQGVKVCSSPCSFICKVCFERLGICHFDR